jgi:hypothetical protein
MSILGQAERRVGQADIVNTADTMQRPNGNLRRALLQTTTDALLRGRYTDAPLRARRSRSRSMSRGNAMRRARVLDRTAGGSTSRSGVQDDYAFAFQFRDGDVYDSVDTSRNAGGREAVGFLDAKEKFRDVPSSRSPSVPPIAPGFVPGAPGVGMRMYCTPYPWPICRPF